MKGEGIGSVASAIVGGMQAWDRKPSDFYPTPADVTYSLVANILDILSEGARVKEPACGDGSMAIALKACGYVVDASDVRTDSGYGQGGMDFLASTVTDFDAIITNPPFSLAEAFIRHGVGQARIFALLLKSQYWHAAGRRILFEQHPPARIYPLTWRPSFLEKERGNSPLMDVLWTVWDREHEGPPEYRPIARCAQSPLISRLMDS